jgi:hypothetical protein
MLREIPIIYAVWDEKQKEALPPIAKVLASQGVLFLRKLVNATIIKNKTYEHTSHETDESGEASIYLKEWNKETQPFGEAIHKAIYTQYDVANPNYEVELYMVDGNESRLITRHTFENAIEIAEILLDHYRPIQGIFYELIYAILDHDRHKVLIFLNQAEYQ